MSGSVLQIRTTESVRYWTLDRPHRRNAVDRQLFQALLHAADAADQDESCRVVVLEGAGPVFCAGSDVRELAQLSTHEVIDSEVKWSQLGRRLRALHVPLIAKIRGAALGGGLMLASYADMRLASPSASFGAPEVRLGWIPPGGIEELIEAIGEQTARELVLFGWRVTAARAYERGIVDYLCDDDDLDEVTHAIAQNAAGLPSTAIRETKAYFASRGDLGAVQREEMLVARFTACVGSQPAIDTLRRASSGAVGDGTPGLLMPGGALVTKEAIGGWVRSA